MDQIDQNQEAEENRLQQIEEEKISVGDYVVYIHPKQDICCLTVVEEIIQKVVALISLDECVRNQKKSVKKRHYQHGKFIVFDKQKKQPGIVAPIQHFTKVRCDVEGYIRTRYYPKTVGYNIIRRSPGTTFEVDYTTGL